jgi:hypothetical protein
VIQADDAPDCPAGSTCGLSGQCRKKRGQPCQGPAECDSGLCVDGVCCNDSCSASCQSCASGTCAPVRDAPDAPQCAGGMGCDSQGACITAPSQVPAAVWPWNGGATGSVFDVQARRPRFRWTATAGATRYEIQVDDSCSVSGYRGCTFPSPEVSAEIVGLAYQPAELPVSMVKPVGRRYYWRVRACNGVGCSPWSVVRYLDVGRQMHDFNGDGYADLLVGGGRNEAWVFQGGANPDTAVDLKVRGTHVAAIGDVNGDGYADMAIGETRYGVSRAQVHLGSATLDTVADLTLSAPGPELFGRDVVGAGDVDADGYSDFLVGAAVDDGPGGRVYLFRGGANPDNSIDLTLSPPNAVVHRFGASMASLGDRNGDGYSDFAVMMSLGPATPVLDQIFIYDGRSMLEDQATYQGAGYGVLSSSPGDLDGDGLGDLAMMWENETHVYFSSSPAAKSDLVLPFASGLDGRAVVMADVDRDGYADVLVGS